MKVNVKIICFFSCYISFTPQVVLGYVCVCVQNAYAHDFLFELFLQPTSFRPCFSPYISPGRPQLMYLVTFNALLFLDVILYFLRTPSTDVSNYFFMFWFSSMPSSYISSGRPSTDLTTVHPACSPSQRPSILGDSIEVFILSIEIFGNAKPLDLWVNVVPAWN